uniref:Uncharacterized protein n=1 Tax=Setaria italica TaxID=4555 RepID=K3YNL1_SETIT
MLRKGKCRKREPIYESKCRLPIRLSTIQKHLNLEHLGSTVLK